MKYRLDEQAGQSLSVLGFGCMRLPQTLGRIDMKRSEELILRAVEAGVNYFDTAYIYPGSEEALGTILAHNQLREKVFVATKLPLVLCRRPEDFEKYFKEQLARLNTDYIDYYLMHMITDRHQWEALVAWGIEDWIAEKKASGQIRQIGFSFHGTRDDFLAVLDAYPWQFTQIQYNYADEHFQAGVTGLRAAHAKGIPVVIMEPLLGGKLAVNLPPKAVRAFEQANVTRSPAGWALRWLWNQPEVTTVLSGMGAMEQLEDNLATADEAQAGRLTEEELVVIHQARDIVQQANKVPCTACNYCMPCPAGVNIPMCFSAYNLSFSMGRRKGMNTYITGTGTMSSHPAAASRCIGCGKCESHCPQHIAIRAELEQVKRRMEPLPYRMAVAVARRVMGKR